MPRPPTRFDWESDLGTVLRLARRAKTDPNLAPESSAAIDAALRTVVTAIVNRKEKPAAKK